MAHAQAMPMPVPVPGSAASASSPFGRVDASCWPAANARNGAATTADMALSLLQQRTASMPDLANSAGALLKSASSTTPSSSLLANQLQADDMQEVTDQRKRSQNRGALAQKRFRERQKEKMRENERQVEQLTAALAAITADKARLESKARLLEAVLSLNLQHEARLHTCPEIMVREQAMLLDDLAAFAQLLGPSGTPGVQCHLVSSWEGLPSGLSSPVMCGPLMAAADSGRHMLAGTPTGGCLRVAACFGSTTPAPFAAPMSVLPASGLPPLPAPINMPQARRTLGAAAMAAGGASAPAGAEYAAALAALSGSHTSHHLPVESPASCGSLSCPPPHLCFGSAPPQLPGLPGLPMRCSSSANSTQLTQHAAGRFQAPTAWRPAFAASIAPSSSSSALASLNTVGSTPVLPEDMQVQQSGVLSAAGSCELQGGHQPPTSATPIPIAMAAGGAPEAGAADLLGAAGLSLSLSLSGDDDTPLDLPSLSAVMDAPELLDLLEELPVDSAAGLLPMDGLLSGGDYCMEVPDMLQEPLPAAEEHLDNHHYQQQQQQQEQQQLLLKQHSPQLEQCSAGSPSEQLESSSGSPVMTGTGGAGRGAGVAGAVCSTGHELPQGMTGEVLGNWSLQYMAEGWYPMLIAHMRQLLQEGHRPPALPSPMSPGGHQLGQLVLWRRTHEDRRALFSHYYHTLWCYNQHATAAAQQLPLPLEAWRQVAAGLQLSPGQMAAVAAARQTLQMELMRVADEWQQILSVLGLELLQVPRERWHACSGVPAMVRNLVQEREAVLAFLHTFVDEVLTPQQEAYLDTTCYPWCPDFWALATTITLNHQANRAAAAATNKPSAAGGVGAGAGVDALGSTGDAGALGPDLLPLLLQGVQALQPLMPFMTAFQLLRAPSMAHGAGLRLKRALLLDPFRTVVPAAAFLVPEQQQLQRMTLMEAHCGSYQPVMLLDWLRANCPNYLNLLPEIASYTTSSSSRPFMPASI